MFGSSRLWKNIERCLNFEISSPIWPNTAFRYRLFPDFTDDNFTTTEREVWGWKEAQRQGEDKVTLQITLLHDAFGKAGAKAL
jgi:hypothetical protein